MVKLDQVSISVECLGLVGLKAGCGRLRHLVGMKVEIRWVELGLSGLGIG